MSLGVGVFYGLLARLLFSGDDDPLGDVERQVLGVMSVSFLFGVPAVVGVLYVFSFPKDRHVSVLNAIFGSVGSSLLALVATLVLNIEGTLCVVMAAPVFVVLAALGGLTGYWIRRQRRRPPQTALLSVALVPFLVSPVEHLFRPPEEVRVVRNEIIVRAQPDAVWNEIASVPLIRSDELPLTFSHLIGLPRPLEATLDFQGVRGERLASFERGLVFRETVTHWEPGTRLSFAIHPESVPSGALDEHVGVGSAYFDVLTGTYTIEPHGDFVVLHLESEQRLSMRFNRYAALWTDFVMSDLQKAILTVIGQRAESERATTGSR